MKGKGPRCCGYPITTTMAATTMVKIMTMRVSWRMLSFMLVRLIGPAATLMSTTTMATIMAAITTTLTAEMCSGACVAIAIDCPASPGLPGGVLIVYFVLSFSVYVLVRFLPVNYLDIASRRGPTLSSPAHRSLCEKLQKDVVAKSQFHHYIQN